MIERKFVAEKLKGLKVTEFISQTIGQGKYSHLEIKKTPLGEKIVIYTSRPGLVVGKKGENIKLLTQVLRTKFKMENPQIEVSEVRNPDLDPQIVADQIANTLNRFGPKRFKSQGYRSLQRTIDAGALGAEIVISGRGLPGSRAKSWRFYDGYMKKSGDIAASHVAKAVTTANLNSGTVGIKVSIMLPDTVLPDRITIKVPQTEEEKKEEVKEETKEAETPAKEEKTEEKPKKKKATKKKTEKKAKPKKEVAEKVKTEETPAKTEEKVKEENESKGTEETAKK